MYDLKVKATKAAIRFKLFTVNNLLQVILVFVLIECNANLIPFQVNIQRHPLIRINQVCAARIKGLIYGRDGKFIYRPSRSNQAHIIVIDDRSPSSGGSSSSSKQTANRQQHDDAHWSNGATAFNKTFSSVEQRVPLATPYNVHHNPNLIHLYAQSGLPPAQPSHGAHLASAGSIRAFYAAPYSLPLISLGGGDLHGAAGQMAAAAAATNYLGGGRAILPASIGNPTTAAAAANLIPLMPQQIQFIAQRAVWPVASGAPQQLTSSPMDAYGYNSLVQPQQQRQQQQQLAGYATQHDFQAAEVDQYRQARASMGTNYGLDGGGINQMTSYYGPPAGGRQRVLPYDQGESVGAQFYDQQQQQQQQQFQAGAVARSEPPELIPFDEPASSPPTPPQHPQSAYLANTMMRADRPYTMKSRRTLSAAVGGSGVGGPVQDLDDAEGDHVDYYDAELRQERTRASMAGPYDRGSSGGGRQHLARVPSTIVVDDGGGPSTSSGHFGHPNQVVDQQQQRSLLSSQNQTPIPGSIQSIKNQLKRSSVGAAGTKTSKLKQSGSGHQSPARGNGLAAVASPSGDSEHHSDQHPNMSGSREQKSSQYWKQYQDQFDIVK